jgi:uncharacterized protein YlxW (UPF0749 family)
MMSTDPIAQQLHDKATRGIALSVEEQARLEVWYAAQDRKESAVLRVTNTPKRLATLHTHIETTLAQLQTVTQRIQELTAQNEAMRREIAVLQRQLAHVPMHGPA